MNLLTRGWSLDHTSLQVMTPEQCAECARLMSLFLRTSHPDVCLGRQLTSICACAGHNNNPCCLERTAADWFRYRLISQSAFPKIQYLRYRIRLRYNLPGSCMQAHSTSSSSHKAALFLQCQLQLQLEDPGPGFNSWFRISLRPTAGGTLGF